MKRYCLSVFVLFCFQGVAQPSFEGLLRINKYDTYVRVIGKGDPIILIHGGPGMDHSYFLPYMDALSDQYKLIYYDSRGMGRSSIDIDSTRFSFKLLVDDIEALRKELKLSKVTVLGHSWGGLLAMNYAIQYPDHLKSLILLNSNSASKEFDATIAKNMSARWTKEDLEKRSQLVSSPEFRNGNPTLMEQLMRLSFKHTFHDKRLSDSLQLFFPPDYKLRAGLLRFLAKDLAAYDFHADLQKITAPTLIIHGEDDIIPVESDTKLHQSISASRLVIMSECGHFPFIEKPREFKRIISEFLRRQKASP
ncbi:MAG: alpha/beta fold hydrolase [Cyclobacteriaceae bacterium]|nr:alpha/beta fold hydrolase [Cyclobacteriaceae bacterium]